MPSWARNSASRTVAVRTSRLSAATWCSSLVSLGSSNSDHQATRSGATTGSLGTGCAGFGWPVSQEIGADQPGR